MEKIKPIIIIIFIYYLINIKFIHIIRFNKTNIIVINLFFPIIKEIFLHKKPIFSLATLFHRIYSTLIYILAIFDTSNDFYTDICFHFNSPNGKDAVLQDRLKLYFPNITLCDPGCLYKGVNLTSMENEYGCKFNVILSNIVDNAIINATVNDILDF